jgi:molecular chaperone GrpE
VETETPEVQPEVKTAEEVAKLEADLEAARKAVDETKDQLLRTLAEYDNFRKRTEKEKAAIYDHAVKDAVSQILNVADTMEMALAHKDCDADDLRKGVEMIDKNMKDALSKLKVEAIGAVGDPFDPELHQAVSHIEDEGLGENVIAQVYQKGYRIGDKMIRHATVVVAN